VSSLRVAAAQINPTVGDLGANAAKILEQMDAAEARGCDLVCFPELAVTGYPPEDLLLKEGFVVDAMRVLDELAAASGECVAIVGCVVDGARAGVDLVAPGDARTSLGGTERRPWLVNAAAVLARGSIQAIVAKRLLPNYAVFDEQRWFLAGSGPHPLFRIAGAVVGVTVCEDLWSPHGPVAELAEEGANLIVSVNASPFSIGQHELRRQVVADRIEESGASIVYVNQVGGQDELVFDGGSMVVGESGRLLGRAASFREELLVVDLDVTSDDESITDALKELSDSSRRSGAPIEGDVADDLGEDAEIYEALVLGTRDYLAKNGFNDAVIGLSGGIDSTIVATIAVDALGAEHVRGISMPSRYSSEHSRSDAQDLAERLGIAFSTIPIEPAHQAFQGMLGEILGGNVAGLTDENLQSRLRGVLLMAVSNETGAIVLTTGNKSEMATGYSTLYGDSAGGFAVIKDVPKTRVYDLCRYRNERAAAAGEIPPIPESVMAKPPSAELRPDQKDEDSLPPYELLDPVLAAYVEGDFTAPELIAQGHDPELVRRVVWLVDTNEYKRRQMPPGPRVTSKAFGKDRRMPITNRYRPS
jgi:NAD+ synthase (glutamine-hydrolysing)